MRLRFIHENIFYPAVTSSIDVSPFAVRRQAACFWADVDSRQSWRVKIARDHQFLGFQRTRSNRFGNLTSENPVRVYRVIREWVYPPGDLGKQAIELHVAEGTDPTPRCDLDGRREAESVGEGGGAQWRRRLGWMGFFLIFCVYGPPEGRWRDLSKCTWLPFSPFYFSMNFLL